MDHWWGPRISVYLREQDYSDELRDEIKHMLGMQLPHTLLGFSTHMHAEDVSTGTVYMQETRERPINHMCFMFALLKTSKVGATIIYETWPIIGAWLAPFLR